MVLLSGGIDLAMFVSVFDATDMDAVADADVADVVAEMLERDGGVGE